MLIASVPAGTVTLSCCGSGRFSAAAAGGGLVDSLVTGVDDAVELSDGSGVTDGPEVIEWLAPLVALLVGAGRYGSDQVAEMPGTRLGEPSADGLVVALAADVEPVELAAAVGSAPSGAALELALLVAVGPTESDAEVAWTGTEALGPVAGAAVAVVGLGLVLGFGRADGLLDALAADFAPARAAGVVALGLVSCVELARLAPREVGEPDPAGDGNGLDWSPPSAATEPWGEVVAAVAVSPVA